ncbi:hypothetical protein ACF1HG_35670 [Streptomyces globisporus]|uniref:hypothetical protein n=1 Tax=Streptomyces globisporus TaxID=1908 RepID=UPI0037006991
MRAHTRGRRAAVRCAPGHALRALGPPPSPPGPLTLPTAGSRATYITADVYKVLNEDAKLADGVNMWEACSHEIGGEQMTIYRSGYSWGI